MSKFHVSCVLPNASALINGIAFEASGEFVPGSQPPIPIMVTIEPVEKDVADTFGAIDGYEVTEIDPEAEAELAALEQRRRQLTGAGKAAAKAAAKTKSAKDKADDPKPAAAPPVEAAPEPATATAADQAGSDTGNASKSASEAAATVGGGAGEDAVVEKPEGQGDGEGEGEKPANLF